MRPLLRWAGSKRKLLPYLRNFWNTDPDRRYVEPFAGSAAHFFDIEPRAALINDANEELIRFYQCMQTDAARIYDLATSWSVDSETYYQLRKKIIKERNSIVRSAIFFYLNRHCFNGIYRTNKLGHFNVPFSGNKTGDFPSWAEVEESVKLLGRASFHSDDFESLLSREVAPNDFVYLDPPYAVENRRVFVQYNAQTFGTADLQRLSDLLYCIDAIGAKFLLSYALSPESRHHFRDWVTYRTSCQRNVAGFVGSRKRAVELLITNVVLPETSRRGQTQ